MHPEDIKAAVRKNGHTLQSVAESVTGRSGGRVTKSAVSKVLHGSVKSQAIASRIAKAAGLPVSALWPGKYPQLETKERPAVKRRAA